MASWSRWSRKVQVGYVTASNCWTASSCERKHAEVVFLASAPGSSTGLAFALWIVGRELLRAGLAMLFLPWEMLTLALVVMVDWGLPGESFIRFWVFMSLLMPVSAIPFALVARSLTAWSDPETPALKRLIWWVFTPDIDGARARAFGCVLVSLALIVRSLFHGQILPLALGFVMAVLIVNMIHETPFGRWMGDLGQTRTDLWLRLAGNPPHQFPHRKDVFQQPEK